MRPLFIGLVLINLGLVAPVGATHSVTSKCPKTCGYDAICENKQCRCRTSWDGKPDFLCYDPSKWHRCWLMCDPVLCMFDNQTSVVHPIGSNTFSKVQTKRYGSKYSTCLLTVYSWTSRFKGKFFTEGVDFVLKVRIYKVYYLIRGRIIAKVQKDPNGNIVYTWRIYFYRYGKWYFYQILNNKDKKSCSKKNIACGISFEVCASNFLVVKFLSCYQQIGIRPYNPYHPNIPGIWVKAPHDAIYWGIPQTLCNKPEGGPNIDDLCKQQKLNSRKSLLTFIILHQNHTSYPDAQPLLSNLTRYLKHCPNSNNLHSFFNKGEALFENAFLIRCLGSVSPNAIINAIFQFIKCFCVQNSYGKALCWKAVTTIKTMCPGYIHYPKAKQFLHTICIGF